MSVVGSRDGPAWLRATTMVVTSTRRRCTALLLVAAWLLPQVPGSAASAESGQDAELRARIESRLSELPQSDGAAISVVVRDRQVVLHGRVRLLEQSLRAEQVAWTTEGVLDVDNELRVVPTKVGDALLERQVRLAIKNDDRFADVKIQIEVLAGVVTVKGTFEDPADVLAFKHRVASIPGVMEVRIYAFLVASQFEIDEGSVGNFLFVGEFRADDD